MREWAADDLERSERAILSSVGVIDKSKIDVITRPDVERESWGDFPVVLEVDGELLSSLTQVESWIASREDNVGNDSSARKLSQRA